MDQPWQNPQQIAPETEELPLAGLLAELLAASDGEPAPSGSAGSADPAEAPAPWLQAAADAPADAGQILRALEGAASAVEEEDLDALPGMLLARLLEIGQPAVETPGSGAAGERSEAASAPSVRETVPQDFAAAIAEGPQPEPGSAPEPVDWHAAMMERLTGQQAAGSVEPEARHAPETPGASPGTAASDWLKEECGPFAAPLAEGLDRQPAAVPECSAPAASAGQGGDADGLAAGSALESAVQFSGEPASCCVSAEPGPPRDLQLQPHVSGLETVWRAASEPAPPSGEPAAGGPEPPGACAAVSGAVAPPAAAESAEDVGLGPAPGGGLCTRSAETGQPDAAAPCPASPPLPAARPAPAAGDARPAAGEEDDFELIDASRAELMVDRLLDAARSAIRSTQAPAAAGTGAPDRGPASPEPGVVAGSSGLEVPPRSSGAEPAPGQELNAAAPPRPAGRQAVPSMRAELPQAGPAGSERRQERLADISPIPPAAMLMALGLPERLRSRLQSLGDVERILHSQPALGAVPEQRPRLLVFQAGGGFYALSMESVREVERLGRVTPVPGAPPFVRGLVNLRGEILPLIDLAALIGKKPARSAQRLIVARAGPSDPLVALLVEELNGLAPLEESQVKPPPQPGLLRGSLEHRGREVLWLEPAAVFGAEALDQAAAAVAETGT